MAAGRTRRRPWLAALLAVPFLGLLLYFLQRDYPIGVDWQHNFDPLSERWRDPYALPTFTSPPWVTALVPHAWLPLAWGNAVNLLLNIAVLLALLRRFGGGWPGHLLVFTAPVFFDLARTNNVEWIPGLAFLLPAQWGLPLLAVKPQVLGGAALVWWKARRFDWRMLAPLGVVVLLSFLVWGWWPAELGLLPHAQGWNFAPWPFGIPLGAWMLWRALRAEDATLAAAATPFLVPYFAPYSLTPLLAILAGKYRREAFFVYVGLWVYVILEARRLGITEF
jgi:hypothetical protein